MTDQDPNAIIEDENVTTSDSEPEITAPSEPPVTSPSPQSVAPASTSQTQPAQPQPAQLTEEQWQNLERQSGLSRQQILFNWSLTQAAIAGSPQTRLVEKESIIDAKSGLPKEFSEYDDEVKKELQSMLPQDRQNSDKIKEVYYKIAGKKLVEGKLKNVTPVSRPSGRVVTGVNDGGSTEPPVRVGQEMPEGMNSDEKEVFRRYGFNNKKEWEESKKRDIQLDEANWKPIFK